MHSRGPAEGKERYEFSISSGSGSAADLAAHGRDRGASILSLLIGGDPGYAQNELRQDLWRAGHAYAGVWLVLSLVALRYVDEAALSEGMRWLVRFSLPAAAILLPAAFFLLVLSPEATEPNGLIYLPM